MHIMDLLVSHPVLLIRMLAGAFRRGGSAAPA
jgi:hypothetical protein